MYLNPALVKPLLKEVHMGWTRLGKMECRRDLRMWALQGCSQMGEREVWGTF